MCYARCLHVEGKVILCDASLHLAPLKYHFNLTYIQISNKQETSVWFEKAKGFKPEYVNSVPTSCKALQEPSLDTEVKLISV